MNKNAKQDKADKLASPKVSEVANDSSSYILAAIFFTACTLMFLILYNFPALTEYIIEVLSL